MGKWLQWIVLTALTGNPILAGVIVLLVWWVADRFTLGILPDPFRFTRRWMRAATLRRQLAANPSDRRARLELAALLLERKRYADALALVKPNVEAGDHDPSTLFVMAQACLGTGHAEQGELFLDEVIERDPNFRMGEVHLERGRWRLQRKDAQGALRALQELASARPGTVEGKVLLARAQRALGDDAAAAKARREAWREYASAPRFQRRRDRLWAWRAKPSRPLLYAAIALACGVLFTRLVAPTVQRAIAADPHAEDRDWQY
jgi:tetratricopeptide (TPR) repeat protein